jgi:hypothetical protein
MAPWRSCCPTWVGTSAAVPHPSTTFTLEYEVDANGMMTGAVRCRRCRPLLVYTAEEYAQWVAMLAHAARKQINEAAA